MPDAAEKLTAGGFIDQVMASSDYRAFLKTLIAEVVDEKIMKRIEKCESDVHDLAGRVRALESSSKENDDLVNEITNLEKEVNDIEQYSRRNSLRVSGIQKIIFRKLYVFSNTSLNESTDELVKKLAEDKLNVCIADQDIDRSHRVGKIINVTGDENTKTRHRQILIKFTNYDARNKVIRSRSKLKGSGITIHEDLTRKNQTLLSKTSKKQGVVSAWSKDGRIFAAVPSTTPGQTVKMLISGIDDLKNVPKVDDRVVEKCKKEQRSRPRQGSSPTPMHPEGMQTRTRTGSLK